MSGDDREFLIEKYGFSKEELLLVGKEHVRGGASLMRCARNFHHRKEAREVSR